LIWHSGTAGAISEHIEERCQAAGDGGCRTVHKHFVARQVLSAISQETTGRAATKSSSIRPVGVNVSDTGASRSESPTSAKRMPVSLVPGPLPSARSQNDERSARIAAKPPSCVWVPERSESRQGLPPMAASKPGPNRHIGRAATGPFLIRVWIGSRLPIDPPVCRGDLRRHQK